MMARVGSMIAPFIATGLSDTAHWIPPVIFGVVPLIGAVLVFFLPGKDFIEFKNFKILTFLLLKKLEVNHYRKPSKTAKTLERNRRNLNQLDL